MTASKTIRCAIYTRKSSDEGLEQAYNTLDAQRDACAAYIASQRHEGWVLAKDRFDDGGVSGGTLERPALTRLLAEIEAGRIAMVVVYKIDRLTRALADFARLVERFEAAGCSFVSVTQAFNTASSMGRLTLNVLLSFAQFEREVTAERIRDKIAASKRQGMWMGGVPPLGYDPHPDPMVRELVVNDGEAETVRQLFTLYAETGSAARVAEAAAVRGLRSKQHVFRSGRVQGDGPLSNGQIHHVLTNPVYRGMIRHKDKTYPGRHPAIIADDLWTKVQETLVAHARRPRGSRSSRDSAPLTGKLRDETGDRLTPTHALKGGRRYRFYVSHRLIAGGPDPTGWRLPAVRFERQIGELIAEHLEQATAHHQLLATADLSRDHAALKLQVDRLSHDLRDVASGHLDWILVGGTIAPSMITLELDRRGLADNLAVPAEDLAPGLETLSASLRLRHRGVEARLILGAVQAPPDTTLLATLRDAHRWAAALRDGTPLTEIARDAGHHPPHIRTRLPLALLSPKIQRAILDGTQPPELTLDRLVRQTLPLEWEAQERICGIG